MKPEVPWRLVPAMAVTAAALVIGWILYHVYVGLGTALQSFLP